MAMPPPLKSSATTAMRGWAILALVLYTAFVAIAGNFTVPPLDRDEARFIQATTQMLETGDYINIRFQQSERNKKPAGIYWLQAASVSLLSDVENRDVWAYRIPSLLAALLSVFLAYQLACRLFDERTAFWGALLLASAPAFSGEATIAKTDSVLLATIIASQAALAHLYLVGLVAGKKPNLFPVLGFWIALAIGVLIKGPIAPMVCFLTIAVLAFSQFFNKTPGRTSVLSWLLSFRPLTGLAVILLIVGPWMAAIGISTEGRFFTEAVGTDMLGKIGQAQESHSGPPGYYLLTVFLMFWPAGLFLPLVVRRISQFRHLPGVLFCLAWLVPGWLVMELASTKLPHYTLPYYPAIAMLVAFIVLQLEDARTELKNAPATAIPVINNKISKGLGAILYLFGGICLSGVVLYFPQEYRSAGTTPVHYLLAASVLGWTLWTTFNFLRQRMRRALLSACLTGGLTAWLLFEGLLPGLDQLALSQNLSETLDEAGLHPLHDKAPPVALAGYYEPSAIFLLGTETKAENADIAAKWLRAAPGHVAIVERRVMPLFLEKIGATPLSTLAVIDGYNYSNGKKMHLTIYTSQ